MDGMLVTDSTPRPLRSAGGQLSLPQPLREYQWTGIRVITERTSALLADEMELGKTVKAAVALSILLRRPGATPPLGANHG